MSQSTSATDVKPRLRPIAHYLPQFHEIPENNLWWGRGFTEWTNVRAATPLYTGHLQPRRPAALGYYDLGDPDARAAQAELARAYGVEAFCYWHYWLAGRRLLEMPFREVLARGEPDFPFCLGWANHDWSAEWVGRPWELLLEQTYPGRADYEAHFREVLPAFQDARYLTVDGRPLFLIYRPLRMPDPREFTDCWRELALRAGLPGLFFVGVTPHPQPAEALGLDATLELGIKMAGSELPFVERRVESARLFLQRALEKTRMARVHQTLAYAARGRLGHELFGHGLASALHLPHRIDQEALVRIFEQQDSMREDRFLSITPNWDNTPRRGRWGTVFEGSSPALFERQLRHAVRLVEARPPEQRLVFIKSWNEWAEGNYIEPDDLHGYGYLEALKRVVLGD